MKRRSQKKNQALESEDQIQDDEYQQNEKPKAKEKSQKRQTRQSNKQPRKKKNKIYSESEEDDYEEMDSSKNEMSQENDDSDKEGRYSQYMEEEIEGSQDADFFNFETDYNQEFCFICKEQGTVICCENCNKSYHLTCLHMKKVPQGMWECHYCKEDQKYLCNYCTTECDRDDFSNLQCTSCCTYMHQKCVGINLQFISDCPMNRSNVLNHEIQMKLDTLKTHDTEENREIFEKTLNDHLKANRELSLFYICYNCMTYSGCEKILDSSEISEGIMYFLYKFDHSSYLNTFWVNAEQAERINPRRLKNYREKLKRQQRDGIEQPDEVVEELDDYTKIEKIIECKRSLKLCQLTYKEIYAILFKENDEENSKYENSLRYGNRNNIKFLVKWRSLNYDKSTWEDEFIVYKYRELVRKFIQFKIFEENLHTPNYRKEIDEYKITKSNKFADKMKKQQPMYITGGCLHSFQLYGVKWISDSYKKDNNVILADEMGLGKTIQTISFLNFLYFDRNLDGPFLIVVPATTMYNWYKELEQWGAKQTAIVYMGNPESREFMRNYEFYFRNREDSTKKGKKLPKVPKFNCLITSYDTAINDAQYLRKFNWETMVVDEAHRLKNNESKFFKIASTIKTKHKLLLTGTPLQNNIIELLNLIEFICPQKAKSLKNYDTLKYFFNSQQAPTKEQQENIDEDMKKDALKELTEVLKPHLLRRKKEDVDIQLPEMEEIVVKISLTDSQKYYYKNVLVKNYDNLKILDTKSKQISKFSLLNILMNLRLICNHPFLFLYKKKYDLPEKSEFEKEFILCSNKLKFLSRVIPKLLAGNHKMLIFSQFVMMLDILGDYLNYKQYPFERLDGQTSVVERQKIIDAFNAKDSKSKIFLLSTRAGGLGINLTSADTIFFIDSDFNPYRDVQAISRAHRMGQQHRVKVYRLVSKYSAEERIIEIATKKLLLESIIINPINKFTKDDFESILSTGSYEMFNKNIEQKEEEFTDEQIDVLLQRQQGETQNKQVENVQLKKNDLNDYYLSGFKFTSLNFETVSDKREDQTSIQQKQKYWETLLDEEANTLKNAQSELLGKGKRVRRTLQQQNYDEDKLSRSNSYGSNFSEEIDPGMEKEKKDSSSADMKGLIEEKIKTGLQKKTKKQMNAERKQMVQEQRDRERKEKESSRLIQKQKQNSKTQKITTKLMNFFEEEVFNNSKVITANMNDKDRYRYVLHGFDEDHRVQFLSYVMEYGTEYENLQEFFNNLCRKRPKYFNSNDKIPPSFNDFRTYLKEFYGAILFYKRIHPSNAIFCQLDPQHLQRRISSLNFLSKKYQYFKKGKPDRFRISHKDYFKYQVELDEQGLVKPSEYKWTNYDDFLLCKVIFSKGFGNWEEIANDKRVWCNNGGNTDEEPWKILFKKLDEKQDRNIDQIDQEKAKKWVQNRLRNRTCNMMNWLLELDEAKQEEI